MKFCFGDIVVVENDLIGVVVKCWVINNAEMCYDVYVRMYSEIIQYREDDIKRYMVRHKYLSKEELEYQYNAMHPFVEIGDFEKFIDMLQKGDKDD